MDRSMYFRVIILININRTEYFHDLNISPLPLINSRIIKIAFDYEFHSLIWIQYGDRRIAQKEEDEQNDEKSLNAEEIIGDE